MRRGVENRQAAPGGGVATLVHKCMRCSRLSGLRPENGLTDVVTVIVSPDPGAAIANTSSDAAWTSRQVAVVNAYVPPHAASIGLHSSVTAAAGAADAVMLVGDFNAQHDLWWVAAPPQRGRERRGDELATLAQLYSLAPLGDGCTPTTPHTKNTTGSILDISFASPCLVPGDD